MRRALDLFKKQGLAPDGYSVNRKRWDEGNKKNWKLFIPSPKGAENTRRCLYELVGFIGYTITGNL